MKAELEYKIADLVKAEYNVDLRIDLTRPEEKFGDYSTNVALQISKQVGINPREIGENLSEKLRKEIVDQISEISIAGPGFINLKLNNATLIKALEVEPAKTRQGQVIVAEYSDPNPFKILHAGHLYTSIVGDSIANLLENAGAAVHRVNFGGDVGLHVAKTMWSILKELDGEKPEKLNEISADKRSEWLSDRYVEGNDAYTQNDGNKNEIVELNKRIYKIHSDDDHETPIAKIYWTTRQWSYDYFNEFYDRLGVKFEKYYPESQTAPIGLEVVKEQLKKGVYKESDGAVVFEGEPHGLHTRVFINSDGLPTYEAKDVGLIIKKWDDYHFDRSIVITANDIDEYMKVVLKSIELFRPELSEATSHLTHGMVRFAGGVKMSSRLGNIVKAVDILDAAATANAKLSGQHNETTVLGAVKYAFIKQRMGGDIIYDPEESVSLEGNSGPYLQYAHARAKSILDKSDSELVMDSGIDLDEAERSLARKITEYPEVVDKATNELMPHHISTYLYELAQTFNRYYEKNRVIGDDRQAIRLILVEKYTKTLKSGLSLLGITAPDRM